MSIAERWAGQRYTVQLVSRYSLVRERHFVTQDEAFAHLAEAENDGRLRGWVVDEETGRTVEGDE